MVKWLKTHYWRMFIAVLHRCLWLKPNSIPHLLHVQRTFPIAHRCYCCVKVVGKLGKVRQHVNPLSHYFQQPLTIQYGWNEQVYKDSTKPLLIDLGCGKGWFCLHYAEAYPDWNVLGLEIRESLVQRAMTWVLQRQLTNLHYMFCNVNVSLGQVLENIVNSKVLRVSIQFHIGTNTRSLSTQ